MITYLYQRSTRQIIRTGAGMQFRDTKKRLYASKHPRPIYYWFDDAAGDRWGSLDIDGKQWVNTTLGTLKRV